MQAFITKTFFESTIASSPSFPDHDGVCVHGIVVVTIQIDVDTIVIVVVIVIIVVVVVTVDNVASEGDEGNDKVHVGEGADPSVGWILLFRADGGVQLHEGVFRGVLLVAVLREKISRI